MIMHNHPAFVALVLAADQSGLYFTPINSHLTAQGIAYIVADSGARVFVGDGRFADEIRDAAQEVDLPVGRLFAVGEADGFRPLEELAAGQPGTPPSDRRAGLAMFYTSGTTGCPKGVRRELPRRSPEDNTVVALLDRLYGMAPGPGVHLTAGPLYHAAPCGFTLSGLRNGRTVVLMDKWDAEETLRLIQEHQVTETHLVPTMFHRLLSRMPRTSCARPRSCAQSCPRARFKSSPPSCFEVVPEGPRDLVLHVEFLRSAELPAFAWNGFTVDHVD